MVGAQSELIGETAERLELIIRNRTEIDVARFQFIGFEYVAEALGARWPQRHIHIRAAAESFISSRLLPDDVLVQSKGGFLAIFAIRVGEAAEQAARDIAFDLNKRFASVGDGPLPQISVLTRPVRAQDLIQMVRADNEGAGFQPTERSESPALGEIDWRFQPVWDAQREMVSSYFLVPVRRDTEERIRGYQFENLDGEGPDFAAIDEASLLVSEQALKRLRFAGKRAVIGVNLHISSLRKERTASRLMDMLAGFDPSLARHRLIKVAGVESDFPKLQLGHIVEALRTRVPQVAVSAAWVNSDVAPLIKAGPTAIGFAYPDLTAMALAHLAGGTLMARFKAGADVAHANGVPLYVEGLIGSLQAFSFREAGAGYIASPVIWRPAVAPDAALKWSADQLRAA